MAASAPESELLKTPLHALHLELGARMVPFAGYSMPVQYPAGLMAEHRHTREAAGLFDISHMGQLRLSGPDAAAAFETLMPVDVIDLPAGKQRYGLLLDDQGGILDDLMFFNEGNGSLFVIVNGACKVADIAHIQQKIGQRCQVQPLPEQALLALQGPQAAATLARLSPGIERFVFMTGGAVQIGGIAAFVTRSGYTGEDGFEISLKKTDTVELTKKLLENPDARLCGLGARDSLRLEAGLCLYGNDLNEDIGPIQAGLTWTIGKSRRDKCDFVGGDVIKAQLEDPKTVTHRRIGLKVGKGAPARGGSKVLSADGEVVGEVTSGGFSPVLQTNIAMGYVLKSHAKAGTELQVETRGRKSEAVATKMPFVTCHYHRPAA